MRTLTCVLVALSLAGSAMAETISDLERIMQLDRDFDLATSETGVEGWVSFFAPEGAMHLANGATVVGHEAIGELMGPAFSDPNYSLRWEPRGGEILIPGVLGYTTGPYEQRSLGADGAVMVSHGTYVSMWRKQDDGQWKIIMDTGSPQGEPTALEE